MVVFVVLLDGSGDGRIHFLLVFWGVAGCCACVFKWEKGSVSCIFNKAKSEAAFHFEIILFTRVKLQDLRKYCVTV